MMKDSFDEFKPIGMPICSKCGRPIISITEKLKGSGINLNDYCIGTNCIGLTKKSYYDISHHNLEEKI